MYIKNVIIDGFKSYGTRIEVNAFDPEFTAITGLNGTGKSNVLDSICFVLGLTNLNKVRAGNLQDLVYKSGQCGVTKATVTLVFDNTNPKQSPLGFERSHEITVARQVVVGNKNKYFLNGRVVPYKKITDMFCSVQLNINNPNFVIMQGHITRVLNMKPQEILSMIEETAGTSLYETKREDTNKLLQKKEGKMNEISSLLDAEIKPKLDRLRADRDRFLEFQKVAREIVYLERIDISYMYVQYTKALDKFDHDLIAVNEAIESETTTMDSNEAQIVALDEQSRTMRQRIDRDSGGELADLQERLDQLTKSESSQSGNKRALCDGLAVEQRNLAKLKRTLEDDRKALAQKEQQMAESSELFEKLKGAEAAGTEALAKAKRNFDAVRDGLVTNEDGEATSLQDQLIGATKMASDALTTIRSTEMSLRLDENKLQALQSKRTGTDASYTRDQQAVQQHEREIAQIEARLGQLDYREGAAEELNGQMRGLQTKRREIEAQCQRYNRYMFQYRDPEPNFDRSRVKGMVGSLVRVRDKRFALALSLAISGSAYSVVVDTDTTAALVMKGVTNRTTFVPMNKITGHRIPDQVVQQAKQLVGADNVWPAIDLIEYDPSLEMVIRHVFGHTLICQNLDQAKKVTYDRRIGRRCVTLDGDVVDPGGSMSGGSAPTGGAALLQFEEVGQLQDELQACRAEMDALGQKSNSMQCVAQQSGKLRDDLDTKRHQLEHVRMRLASSSVEQHEQECAALRRAVDDAREAIRVAREQQKTASAKEADIREKLSDATGYREREMKKATETLAAAKKHSERCAKEWSQHERDYEMLRLQIDELRSGQETASGELGRGEEKLAELQKQIDDMSAASAELKEQVDALKAQIKAKRDEIGAHNRELKSIHARKEQLNKSTQNLQLEIKKKQKEIDKLKADKQTSSDRLNQLESSHAWIAEDKQHFGAKNTRYDFQKTPPQEARKMLAEAHARKKSLQRNLNEKAMMVLEREEQQFVSMSERKEIVGADKHKIENIIVDLDDQKREQVKDAWQSVSQNFGTIFSTLLPGAQAELVANDKNDFMRGLKVRIGFNGMWKDSLSELSGGQRSLVALALILGMLKYKPAPFYILDEVDAALDMSHTQNIGKMLKQHFTNSQFIVVSLKDGMFNNANVLFKTRFENGVSSITRTAAANKR